MILAANFLMEKKSRAIIASHDKEIDIYILITEREKEGGTKCECDMNAIHSLLN